MDIQRDMICIVCPMGCRLQVRQTDTEITVQGNTCPRGEKYGREELLDPRRTLTTSVRVQNGAQPLVSVRSAAPLPRVLLPQVLDALHALSVQAPVHIGDVVLPNALNSGIDICATRNVEASEE